MKHRYPPRIYKAADTVGRSRRAHRLPSFGYEIDVSVVPYRSSASSTGFLLTVDAAVLVRRGQGLPRSISRLAMPVARAQLETPAYV